MADGLAVARCYVTCNLHRLDKTYITCSYIEMMAPIVAAPDTLPTAKAQ